MAPYPSIDPALCNQCGGCVEVAPQVFAVNPATGMIEVVALPSYPREEVAEAIRYCPKGCISWELCR